MSEVTFDTAIKEVARGEEWEFLEEHTPHLGKPREDLVVSCFPYTTRDKAREISDVLIPAGIKPWNIIGIEREQDRYGDLVAQELGIDLHLIDAIDFYSDYFSHYNRKIDIALKDFQGEFSREVVRILENIAGNQILSPKGIFLLNVFGSRELSTVSANYRLADRDPFKDGGEFRRWLQHNHPEKARSFNFALAYGSDPIFFNLYREFTRDVGITRLALRTFLKGRDNLYLPQIFLDNPEFEQLGEKHKRDFLQTLEIEAGRKNSAFALDLEQRALNGELYFVESDGRKVYVDEFLKRRPDRRKLLRREVDDDFLQASRNFSKEAYCSVFNEQEFNSMQMASLHRQLGKNGFDPVKATRFLLIYSNKPYFLIDSRRRRYENMHLDMYCFDQHGDTLERCYGELEVSRRNGALTFRISRQGLRYLDDALKYLGEEKERTLFPEPTPRGRLTLDGGVQ